MKSPQLIYGFVLLTSLSISCGKTGSEGDPAIGLVAGQGFVTGNKIVSEGTALSVAVYAEARGRLSLRRFTIQKNGYPVTDTVISRESLYVTLEITKGPEYLEDWVFTVTDDEGAIGSLLLALHLKADIKSVSAPVLGAQKSQLGPCYSSEHNKRYTLAQAYQYPDSIDFLYYFNAATKNARLISPDNSIADTVYTGTNGIVNWSERNNTFFLPAGNLVSAQYDTLTTDWFFQTAFQKQRNSWSNQTGPLTAGGLFFVRFSNGIYGLIRISTLNPGPEGSVEFEMKLQDFD